MTAADELDDLRGPLTGYCYRLLGAAADTDDAVQETLLRAVRAIGSFDPDRGRLTTWVHRIATNVCLDMVKSAHRRTIVTDFGPATDRPDLTAPLPERWVDPMPDSRLLGHVDPAERVAQRDTIRLAFVAALQQLPPRQRAVLILRDVLAFSAAETAEIVDASATAVNSALQRARANLTENPPAETDVLDLDDPDQQELLERYVAAFESHDVDALTALLHEDATTSMPPFAWWMRGGAQIAALMTGSDACAGDRLIPVAVNGSPGFGQYRPDENGVLCPFALTLTDVAAGRIVHTVTFLGTGERFAEFGLPENFPRDR